jgi:hypothetical protein
VKGLSPSSREPILKHKSIDMVGLMLKTASQGAGAKDFDIVAKLILASA